MANVRVLKTYFFMPLCSKSAYIRTLLLGMNDKITSYLDRIENESLWCPNAQYAQNICSIICKLEGTSSVLWNAP